MSEWKQVGKHWYLYVQGPGKTWLVVRMDPMAGTQWIYDVTLTFEGSEQHALRTVAPGAGGTLDEAKADAEARIATLRELLGWSKGGAQ